MVVFGFGIFVTKCSWETQRLCLGVFNTFNPIMDRLSEVGLPPSLLLLLLCVTSTVVLEFIVPFSPHPRVSQCHEDTPDVLGLGCEGMSCQLLVGKRCPLCLGSSFFWN